MAPQDPLQFSRSVATQRSFTCARMLSTRCASSDLPRLNLAPSGRWRPTREAGGTIIAEESLVGLCSTRTRTVACSTGRVTNRLARVEGSLIVDVPGGGAEPFLGANREVLEGKANLLPMLVGD